MSAYRQDCEGCREEIDRSARLSARLDDAELALAAATRRETTELRATVLRRLPWSYFIGFVAGDAIYYALKPPSFVAPATMSAPWLFVGVFAILGALGWALAFQLLARIVLGALGLDGRRTR